MLTRIGSGADADDVQCGIEAIAEWATLNKMQLNPFQCKVVSFFSLRKNKLEACYMLNGVKLKCNDIAKDLGVMFDQTLVFTDHFKAIVQSASKSLGFVIRICHHFKNTTTFYLLYNALVRSKLEYASVVWSPQFECYSHAIELIRMRYLRFLYYRKHNIYSNFLHHPVSSQDL